MTYFLISGDVHDTTTKELRLCISEALKIDNIKPDLEEVYIDNEIFSLYFFEFCSYVEQLPKPSVEDKSLFLIIYNKLQDSFKGIWSKPSEALIQKPVVNNNYLDRKRDFLSSSSYEGSFEDVKNFAVEIARSLYKRNIKFEFELSENSDANDNPCWVIRYPGYYCGNVGTLIDFQEGQI
jgi:hypothetical protein